MSSLHRKSVAPVLPQNLLFTALFYQALVLPCAHNLVKQEMDIFVKFDVIREPASMYFGQVHYSTIIVHLNLAFQKNILQCDFYSRHYFSSYVYVTLALTIT